MSDATDALHDTAQTTMDRIRSNPNTSPDAKRSAIAKAYITLADGLEALKARQDTDANSRRDALSRKLFGLPSGADPATMASFRSAQDRANSFNDESTAIAQLNSAAVVGDDLLVRAILQMAYTDQLADVVNAYTARYPQNEAAAEELWDLTTSLNTAPSFLSGADYYVPVPPELTGMSPWKIREIASGVTPTIELFASSYE